jgi:hypothetical protein
MALPPRPFHLLNDIAIRWGVMPIDIVGWAADGLLALSIAVPPTKTASSRILCDLVEVAATDVLPLFRPSGAKLEKVVVRRARAKGETEWEWIGEPAEGIAITAPDVLVTRAEVERFERAHGLHKGGDAQEPQALHRRPPGPGAPPRYDWDTFFAALMRRIFVQGLPSTQAELVREMLDWFQNRSDKQAPDESTVRRKIAMVWRELNRPM